MMYRSKILGLLILILLIVVTNYSNDFSENVLLIKSVCKYEPRVRNLTGFRISEKKGVITALHGVDNCADIMVLDSKGNIYYKYAQISEVDVKRDIALLTPLTPHAETISGFDTSQLKNFFSEQKFTVVGNPYSLEKSIKTSIETRNPPIKSLIDLVPKGKSLNALLKRDSPSPYIEVLFLQGTLLPGHSGAPIIDSRGNVVAIANGGLNKGFSEIVWAIPFKDIRWSAVEKNSQLQKQIEILSKDTDLLFSIDSNKDVGAPSSSEMQDAILNEMVKRGGYRETDKINVESIISTLFAGIGFSIEITDFEKLDCLPAKDGAGYNCSATYKLKMCPYSITGDENSYKSIKVFSSLLKLFTPGTSIETFSKDGDCYEVEDNNNLRYVFSSKGWIPAQ